MGRIRRSWTAEEDALLRKAVKSAMADSRPLLWRELAKAVPGRSNKDCRRRWWNSLADCTSKGPWAEDEDERLLEAVREHGTNWAQVARYVGSRNSDQCSSHWSSVLDPEINFADWTDAEDADLLHAVLTHGTNWATIATSHRPKRTTLALKNRYSTLRLRHNNTRGKKTPEGAEKINTRSRSRRNPSTSNTEPWQGSDRSLRALIPTEWDDGGDDDGDEDGEESSDEYQMDIADHDMGFYTAQDACLVGGADDSAQPSHPLDDHTDFLFADDLQALTDPQLSEWNHASSSELVDHLPRTSLDDVLQRPDEGSSKNTAAETYLQLTPSSVFTFLDNPQPGNITTEPSPPLSTPEKPSGTVAGSGQVPGPGLPADPGQLYQVSIEVVCSGAQLQSVVNMAGFGSDFTLKISPRTDSV